MLEKGLQIKDLLNSAVFKTTFDFDEWPGSHSVNKKSIKPYNKSIFDIRYNYDNIFNDPEFDRDYE